ncbi:hypothetical protein D3C81_1601370 [compost metagenome]
MLLRLLQNRRKLRPGITRTGRPLHRPSGHQHFIGDSGSFHFDQNRILRCFQLVDGKLRLSAAEQLRSVISRNHQAGHSFLPDYTFLHLLLITALHQLVIPGFLKFGKQMFPSGTGIHISVQ